VSVLVLFALEREAAPFRRAARALPHVSIHVSGVGRRRAREAAERLLAESRLSLAIAAGFCGALVPALRVGDIVRSPQAAFLTSPLAGEVAREASGWGVSDFPHAGASPPTRRVQSDAATSPPTGEVGERGEPRILTVDHLVSDAAEKCRLGQLHDAVDMESAAIEEVCAARGVPFLAVRAVSDCVDTALSSELVRLLSGGSVSVRKACGALLRKPSLLGEFLRLGRDTKFAARKLSEALVEVVQDETLARRARVSS
jgi:adenosylhomocysteine nucleosidase